jgi:hypothetical protein
MLDLQGLTTEENGGGGGGGSTATIALCQSHTPSNVSLLICH